jgi:hypothetical protein
VTELLTVLLKSAGIYLALALVASAMSEAFDLMFGLRSRVLQRTIHGMLREGKESQLERKLYEHPLIASLSPDRRLPAYVPSSHFAGALADLVFKGEYGDAREMIRKNTDGQLRTGLLALVRDEDSESQIKDKLAKWYEAVVRQSANLYRRQALWIVFGMSLLLAISINLDPVRMFSVSARESANREILSSFAKEYAKAHKTEPVPTIVEYARQFASRVEIPFGWESPPKTLQGWLGRIFGFFLSAVLITIAAVALFSLFRGGTFSALLKK